MNAPQPHLVGRDQEMTQLTELWQAACQGQEQTLFVTGEAGMGKSTLVEAFMAQLEGGPAGSREKDDPGPQIARGDCSEQFGREEAFLPFAEALADLLQTEAQDQTTARKLLNVVYDCAPAWMGIVPVVGDVLGGLMETARAAREHFGSGEQAQVSPPDQNRAQETAQTMINQGLSVSATINDAWDADDLRSALLGARNDISNINAHFTYNLAIPAQVAGGVFLADEVRNASLDLTGTINYPSDSARAIASIYPDGNPVETAKVTDGVPGSRLWPFS